MLAQNNVEVVEIVEARKIPLEAEATWNILSQGSKIVVAKGKSKLVEFDPASDDREAILKVALGRSGKLRAPTVRMGDLFLVGYNEPLYQNYFVSSSG